MAHITVGTENSTPIELYYEDHGTGTAGRPDPRLPARRPLLGEAGPPRCSTPATASSPTTAAASASRASRRPATTTTPSPPTSTSCSRPSTCSDVVLVGFSMGTGEVARYLGTYGSERVAKVAFLASLEPFLLKTDDNPAGVDRHASSTASSPGRRRPTATPTSPRSTRTSTTSTRTSAPASARRPCAAAGTSPPARPAYASVAAVPTWPTDFRADIPKIDVPAADPARHRRPHPADRRHRRDRSTSRSPRPTTSRSTAPRTACCGPTPTRSTRRC